MLARGWGGSAATAVSVGGIASAAQLGLAYGLGIVAWNPSVDTATGGAWLAGLAWITWIAGGSTLLGAVVADHLAGGRTGFAPSRAGGERTHPGDPVPDRPEVPGDSEPAVQDAGGTRGGDPAPDGTDRPGAAGPAPGGTGTRMGDAGRRAPRDDTDRVTPLRTATNLTWRLVLAVSAAAGGMLTVPLAALPASAVHRPQAYAPQAVAAGYAFVGVVLGILAALAALSARAVALNLVATAAWLWLVAIAAVLDGVTAGDPSGTVQIAVWRFGPSAWSIRDALLIDDVLLMLGSALVIGALCAWWPARRRDNRVAVAVSGAAGPLLVAAAYFLAAPRFTATAASTELSPYLIAPYAVIAGLAGSVLATALSDRRGGEPAGAAAAGGAGDPSRPDGPGPGNGAGAVAAPAATR